MKKHSIAARDLVEHSTLLDGQTRVCDLLAWFKTNPQIQYVAILSDSKLAGLVGRDQIHARLADKYGYSVLANRPVTAIMNPTPVTVYEHMEVHEITRYLLNSALENAAFYQDIVVVGADGQFTGLASVKRLLHMQMNQSMEQLAALERQAETLTLKNQELVATSLKLRLEDSEFRVFFETCSVPLLMLDAQNQFVQANRKIMDLLGYRPGTLTPGLADTHFIAGGVERFKHAHREAQSHFGEDQSRYFIVFQHANGTSIGAEVALDLHASDQRMVLSLLRIATRQELELHLKMLKEAEAKGEKAQSLVSTLIDRSSDTAFMMRKMENMFTMADQLDLPVEQDKATSLQGSISDFSVTDLAQLLIYGGKTGQLRVFNAAADGLVFFENGKIVHAEIGFQTGEAALAQIIAIQTGEFSFTYEVPTTEQTIAGDPTGLLIRLCTKRDEALAEFVD